MKKHCRFTNGSFGIELIADVAIYPSTQMIIFDKICERGRAMAGFGWNYVPSGGGQPPRCSRQVIACRLCDKVFLSTQALINHVGSHIPEEDGEGDRHFAFQRILHPRHPSRSTSPFPTADAGKTMFFHNGFRLASAMAGREKQMIQVKVGREEAAGGLTKPYIKQLEKRNPKVGGLVDEEEETWKLDLSLSL